MPLPKFCTVASTPRNKNKRGKSKIPSSAADNTAGNSNSKKVDDDDEKDETINADSTNSNSNTDSSKDQKKKAKKGKSNEKEETNNNDNDKDIDDVNNEDQDDEEEDGDDDDCDDDDDDEDDEDDDDDASCLHCHLNRSSNGTGTTTTVGIQVRCDECGSYICNTCHWCHEFQANHEIRVCDRCDAFYCRSCDEMDQCDDCGEVVCATCSTLLSCKFCGGGLCEDCATACGRCGIVLCSKDAKFAVDCDTCRLSYCLVCLASGNKDPCVRCGHRPSKRMEQLVHLRLKSIYKAFKQSSTTSSSSISGGCSSAAAAAAGTTASAAGMTKSSTNSTATATTSNSTTASGSNADGKIRSKNQHPRHNNNNNNMNTTVDIDCLDEYDLSDDPAALMFAAAATASAVHKATTAAAAAKSNSSSHGHHHGSFTGHSSGGTTGSGAKHKREAAAAAAAAAAATISTNAVKEAVEKYKAEKAKADAAAAALLAELDEEEEQVNAKKRKKKKKRQRQKIGANQDEDDDDDRKMAATTTSTSTSSQFLGTSSNSNAPKTRLNDAPASSARLSHTSIQDDVDVDDDDDDDDDSCQQKRKEGQRGTPSPTADYELQETSSHESEAAANGGASSNYPAADTMEQEFESLEEEENIQGLNELLASIKGVPGRAVLRKNIKKAIKRFKAATEAELRAQQEEEEEEEEEVIALPPVSRQSPSMMMDINNRYGAVTPIMPEGALRTSDLLKIVPVGAVPSCPSALGTAPRVVKAAPAATVSPSRSECVMKMSPIIVGWVIGKGGQRIRDLMEESGAKIWIDQDSMAPHEPRIVYVSGYRKNVDEAVRMIKDLVAKAPAETPQSKPQTKTATMAAPHSAPAEMTQHNVNAPPGPVGGGVAGLPDMMSSENFRLRPRKATSNQSHHGGDGSHSHHGRSNNGEPNRARHEITCDPRFVPLLIGRRGWTVKNIQDSSGARVDIDQTVTPRKITISGSETSVEIAVRMVRDVLSYPHSQLHGTAGHHVGGGTTTFHTTDNYVAKSVEETEQPEHFPPPMDSAHFPKPEHFAPVASETPKRPAPLPPAPPVAEQAESPAAPSPPAVDEAPEPTKEIERPQTPPPSSLIMPGDAKSTISASSSLSSTPEPSMASSSKGNIAAVAPGPMLPPMFGSGDQYHGQDSSNDFIGFPSSRLLATGGNMLGFGQTKDPSFGRPSPSPPLPLGGPAMLQSHPISGAVPMGNHMRPLSSGPFPFGSIAGEHQTSLPIHQQSAFHSSGPGFPQVHPTPDSQRCIINPLQPPSASGAMARPGMWNGPPPAPPVGPGGFGLAAAVDFLHHSTATPHHPAALPVPSQHGAGGIGVNGFMGLPSPSSSAQQPEFTSIGLERGLNQPLLNPGTPGREDSRMIDSLFGPSDLGVGTGATSIVGGLQGLSLGNDAACPGLWDTMAVATASQGDSLKALCGGLVGADLSNPMRIPEQAPQCSLFPTAGLDNDLMNMNDNHNIPMNQHPPHSRFAWGEGHQRDG